MISKVTLETRNLVVSISLYVLLRKIKILLLGMWFYIDVINIWTTVIEIFFLIKIIICLPVGSQEWYFNKHR